MPVPELIPIRHMEDLHTALVGRCADGTQFFLNDFTDGSMEVAVLYHFDVEGNCIQHNIRRTRLADADAAKAELLSTIGVFNLCDIAVRPFAVSVEGKTYGLVVNATGESVELQPHSQISFMDPWDGEYYT